MTDKLNHHICRTSQLPEADTHFLPPRVLEGKVMEAVLVSKGEMVEVVDKQEIPSVW